MDQYLRLEIACWRNAITTSEDKPQENNKKLSEDALRLLERGGGIGASRKARILSTVSAPCYKDPYLCQLSVSCAKRRDISKTPGEMADLLQSI